LWVMTILAHAWGWLRDRPSRLSALCGASFQW
jgi:hypothetical protein